MEEINIYILNKIGSIYFWYMLPEMQETSRIKRQLFFKSFIPNSSSFYYVQRYKNNEWKVT